MDLVTGGAGFIGSHLVLHLVGLGRGVRVVDDLSTGMIERLESVRGSIDFVKADLARVDLGPIVADVDRIFHLAAVPSVPRSVRDPLTSHSSVATATLRLLIAARDSGVQRFVLSSSSSVYGETDVSPKHEGLPLRPLSPYAVAKVAAENYARVAAHLYGLSTVSLRYFNVFGPRQDPSSPYAAVIPRFIRAALKGQTLTIHGDGEQTRDFTFVDDVVAANIAAARSDGPTGSAYNIAAGDARTVKDLVDVLEGVVGRPIHVEHDDPRPGDIRHSQADVSAAARDLSWRPAVGLADGLRRTVEWYRSHTA
jgi:UDP-N-acetylglucosamine/UDP-N-acetyl-alpha-D-glucosaminouronate 4-epimerase